MNIESSSASRRRFLTAGGATLAAAAATASADESKARRPVIRPPEGKTILLSVKLGMLPKKLGDKQLTLTERLKLAGDAGLDGVDFDQAGGHTEEEARSAVEESGVFVHNAINHAHWSKRLTSPNEADRDTARKNIEHCIRVSHAAGGNGVLIVVGSGNDGDADEIEERCRTEIKKMLPLAAALGQPILFENVWNKMFYDHDSPPEQSAERHVKFIDSFNSQWVGQYFDIGNHQKYGKPAEWIRTLGKRIVKLDVKDWGVANGFCKIGEGDVDWPAVRNRRVRPC